MGRSWEEVVVEPRNKYQIAVGTTTYRINGKDVKVDVIKPRNGQPYVTFANTAVRLSPQPDRHDLRELVDGIRSWRPWSR